MRHLFSISLLVLGLACGCGQKKAGAGTPASLDELNRALTVAAMRSGSFPPSTNELVTLLGMSGKTMPVPPPGKRLAIDPAKRQFVLVDQ